MDRYCIGSVGIKFDLSSASDLTEALSLGYKNNYIHIYSNSWGPLDKGFIVSGPGHLAERALESGVAQVRLLASEIRITLDVDTMYKVSSFQCWYHTNLMDTLLKWTTNYHS